MDSPSIDETIISSKQIGVAAYPNPLVNSIEINITGGVAGEYKLMLVDASGKGVWTKNGIKNAGDFQQSINTSALKRGIYFLKVIQNNNSSVIKLVK
jgi:predicted restriction endonuclease